MFFSGSVQLALFHHLGFVALDRPFFPPRDVCGGCRRRESIISRFAISMTQQSVPGCTCHELSVRVLPPSCSSVLSLLGVSQMLSKLPFSLCFLSDHLHVVIMLSRLISFPCCDESSALRCVCILPPYPLRSSSRRYRIKPSTY